MGMGSGLTYVGTGIAQRELRGLIKVISSPKIGVIGGRKRPCQIPARFVQSLRYNTGF